MIELKELAKKDFGKAIDFAVTGMHFERYTTNPFLLKIYGRYFLYLEMERATQVIAAYEGDKLVGILMAVIKGEKTVPTAAGAVAAGTKDGSTGRKDSSGAHGPYHSFWRALYVKVVGFMVNHLFGESSSSYDEANHRILVHYKRLLATEGKGSPDGEICFLAADPATQGKGIGSKLLAELERREPGKLIYLFTDSNCTWQFYEHKGFERVGEQEIEMEIAGADVPLTCLLYAKTTK